MRAKLKHASIVTKPTKPAEQIGKEKYTGIECFTWKTGNIIDPRCNWYPEFFDLLSCDYIFFMLP